MRATKALVAALVLSVVSLLPLTTGAGAQSTGNRPGPVDPVRAAAAGRDAVRLGRPGVADETIVPAQFTTARVFATQYVPNGAGSVEVAVPDKCAKFAALRNTTALSSNGCPSGYELGLDYRVVVTRDNGRSQAIPVKDVGPWNEDDNYWDYGGTTRPRRKFSDLAPGVPEAQAAFTSGYNLVRNCTKLDGTISTQSAGADQFGRCVLNPAGIDLSVPAATNLGLGDQQNEWVTVTFLWAPVRNTIVSANSGKDMDVNDRSTADGASVIQWPDNGDDNQQWRFEAVGTGVFRIVSVHSGKVLDVRGASTNNGADLIQWPWNGGGNQKWRFEAVGPNVFRIVSVLSGKVVDVSGASLDNGAPIIQWPWNSGANQQWSINPVGNN